MKVLIIYESKHHGNTKKLVDAIAEHYEVEVVNAAENPQVDYSAYDIIGFASGIAYGKFYKNVTSYAHKLPEGKKVFFLYTCANTDKDFAADIRDKAEMCGCTSIGSYGCKGYNTYGPLKLIGGMNRNHPDQDEIAEALHFYKSLIL